jgi:hypothetical protein
MRKTTNGFDNVLNLQLTTPIFIDLSSGLEKDSGQFIMLVAERTACRRLIIQICANYLPHDN